jgi:hypothetical protein
MYVDGASTTPLGTSDGSMTGRNRKSPAVPGSAALKLELEAAELVSTLELETVPAPLESKAQPETVLLGSIESSTSRS